MNGEATEEVASSPVEGAITPPSDAPAATGNPLRDAAVAQDNQDAIPGDQPTQVDSGPKMPDYIPEKFWDSDKGEVRVESLAKSYHEMEKMVSRGENKAPEGPMGYFRNTVADGRWKAPEGVEASLPSDDPILTVMAQAAYDAGLSEAQFASQVNAYLTAASQSLREPTQEELNEQSDELFKQLSVELGPNGQKVIETNAGWLNGLKNQRIIDEDMFDAAIQLGTTRAGIEFLETLRIQRGGAPIPRQTSEAGETIDMAKWEEYLHSERYATDNDFRRWVDNLGEELHGRK